MWLTYYGMRKILLMNSNTAKNHVRSYITSFADDKWHHKRCLPRHTKSLVEDLGTKIGEVEATLKSISISAIYVTSFVITIFTID